MISEKESIRGNNGRNLHFRNAVNMLCSEDTISPKLVYDNDTFDILHCNTAAAEFFGYAKKELVKLKLSNIFIDDFNTLADTGLVDFPVTKLNRLVQSKNKALYSCETKDYDLDFETSVLVFENIIALNVHSVLQLLN